MKTLVNVIHPHFEASRVNRALAAAAQEVEHVTVRHLYALYPDGVIDIEAEHVALEAADRIVLQFPMYSGTPAHRCSSSGRMRFSPTAGPMARRVGP